jgi:hypothetical protein
VFTVRETGTFAVQLHPEGGRDLLEKWELRCSISSLSKTQRRYNTAMDRRQAFKFLVLEDGEQRRQMRRYAGSVRFVYNRALALQQEMYELTVG